MKIDRLNRKCFLLLVFVLFTGIVSAQTDIEIVKNRMLNEAMNRDLNDSRVARLIGTFNEDGTWPGINYTDVSNTGFEHRNHTGNMVQLARAYKNASSKYFKKKSVKTAIESALQYWVENDFICENWWHNQIGTPHNLVTLMLIIGDELDENLVKKAQPIIHRANVDAPGARPGGDRIKIAGIQAKNALFLNDDEDFNKVVRIIENEIKYVEWVGAEYGFSFRYIPTGFSNRTPAGRGIQYDNSFHHRVDGVNNTISYGLSYADAFVEWAIYTSGTKFKFSEEKLAQLIDYYLDGICKTTVFGKFPDAGAKNRSITRPGTLHKYSSSTAKKMLLTTDYRKNELQEIVDIRDKDKKPTLSHATYFWHSEHFTFQRPDFFTSVRLYSTRTFNMEQAYNSEGLLNHHRGDGTNHISVTGDEYYDLAPVFDYQRIPGTTVMQKSEMPSSREVQKLGRTDFVGAVTDGKYAAVAFDFMSPHDPLIARKSWFFFDEEYVCLGAGISCKSNSNNVYTTLNQSLLRSDVTFSSQNKKSVIPEGEKGFENIDWVYHDGIAYVFPNPTSVSIKNGAATGSWYRVNKQSSSSKREIKKDVFKIWLDHGKRASEEKYEYIVIPATSIEKLEKNKTKENIKILINSPDLQSVVNTNLGICQTVFYKNGEIEISDQIKLKSDSPGIVMIKYKGNNITEISVVDPARELGKIHLSVSTKIEKSEEGFHSVWNEKNKVSEISIDLPKGVYAGKSVTIDLK